MKNNRINLRLNKSDLKLLYKVCELRGETVSSFTRRAIKTEFARLELLSKKQKDVLGVVTNV